jgi:hypothetical protein
VCGVATPDIAQAFLVAEPTMAARLTRAKKKIAAARIPYAVPSTDELPERVDAVLTVIHLLYAAGHTAHSGENLVRDELTARALDLARMLRLLLPGDREAAGLLALLHAQAPSYAQTDWPQILTLYDELLRVWPSPVVALNRAVAVSMVDGPEVALAEVEALERAAAWPATAICRRPRRTCCTASAVTRRRRTPTGRRWRSAATPPSRTSWPSGSGPRRPRETRRRMRPRAADERPAPARRARPTARGGELALGEQIGDDRGDGGMHGEVS